MKIVSRAPTRVDLAGGTLDIWPLYLFHEDAQTINFATTLYATCVIEPRRDKRIHLKSHDLGLGETFGNLAQLIKADRYKLPLLARLIRFFAPLQGLTLTTTSEAPAGAGIAGSSALNIAVCGALNQWTGAGFPKSKFVEIARNVEAQVIRVPTGDQDFYPATYGGVNAIRLTPGGVIRERVRVDSGALLRRLVLAYTGFPRESGINNWEVMKAHIDGDKRVIRNFTRIAEISRLLRWALERQDWEEVGRLIQAEWNHRKRNAPGITTPLIERLTRVASRHGATAAKVCGAGGGGCVLFYVEEGAKRRVAQALASQGGRILPVGISARGLAVRVCRT